MHRKEGTHLDSKIDPNSPRLGLFSIANQIRYGFLLFVTLIVLVTAVALIVLAFQAQRTQLEVAQQERSRAAAGEIDAYLDDLQRKLGYLARVRGLVDLPSSTQQDLIEGLIRHNTAYELVAILDNTGQVMVSRAPFGEPISGSLADEPLFVRAFKLQEDYVGPVELDPELKLPFVTLAVPIRDAQDEVAGVLLAQVNLEFLWNIVSRTDVGQTGYVYVIDNRNFLVAEKGKTSETFELADISDRAFIRDLTSGNVDTLTTYNGLRGSEVLGSISPIHSTRWNVVVELPTREAFAPVLNMLVVMGGVLLVAILITVSLGIFFSRQIVLPMQQLTAAAAQLSAGKMDTQVDVNSYNEMGILATTFNQMTAQLKELYSTLEQRVADRTQRLEIVANLSEQLTAILDFDQLLVELVNQVKERFSYYHAQVYIIDEERQFLIMTAGAGEAGEQMKAQGHAILLEAQNSLVARAAGTGQIVRADNVREVDDWLPNPLLPDTYAEMSVPITLGVDNKVVGVLDVQEDQVGGLDESDASLLRSLANQVAVAIRNARLFAEVEAALNEAHALQRRYLEQAWNKERIARRNRGHVQFTLGSSAPLEEDIITVARQKALTKDGPTPITLTTGQRDAETNNSDDAPVRHALVAPLKLRNTTIGDLQLHDTSPDRQWTEEELALITAVMDQVAQAAESLRLLDETQERASRERLIGQISDKFRRAPDIETLLKMGVEELSRVLKPHRTFVYMGSENELNIAQKNSEAVSEPERTNGSIAATNAKEAPPARNGHGDQ